MEMINLKIDNKLVSVSKGTTVLKAAASVGIDIPTLCYMKLEDMNIENKPGD
jgi:NADP-reducing hydrogenase subunit HndD